MIGYWQGFQFWQTLNLTLTRVVFEYIVYHLIKII